MDLIDDPQPGENAPEFSVSEISGAVKRVIEGEFDRVRVRGEVGRVFVARSGHLYFDLKDDRNVLASVAWKGQAARPEEGMEVVATGRMTTFGSQSKYQLNVEDLRPAGVGALMAMLEKRKKLLEAEGLFAPERKRPLPFLPEVIGVVTSPSGAVIRDILHRLRERFPRKVLVWPVAVQGQACAAEVAAAIAGFNALTEGGALPRPDLIIVARGGGSIEDLWGFNEDVVARAAAASRIPLISAVGHETDTTLIDYVSDRRAPTPTAAAEIAVPVRLELLAAVDALGARLTRALGQAVTARRQRLGDLARGLPRPEALTQQAAQRLDALAQAHDRAIAARLERGHARLDRNAAALRPGALAQRLGHARSRLTGSAARFGPALFRRRLGDARKALDRNIAQIVAAYDRLRHRAAERLEALERVRLTLGYEATLARGYAVVWEGDAVVTTKAKAEQAGALDIQFRDGRFHPGPRAPKRKKSAPKPPPEQGDLF